MYLATASHIQPEAWSLHSWLGQDLNALNNSILEAAASLQDSQKLSFIDELISIDKLSARSAVLNPLDVYDLHQEAEHVRAAFKREICGKHIGFSIHIAADLPAIYSDTNSLRIKSLRENILDRVLSNAIRHTPSGGEIAIHIEKFGDHAIAINISDSRPFQQPVTQTSRHTDQPSNGSPIRDTLDLHKALLCAQAHNGTLSVVERPEYPGITVQIEFPLYGSYAH
ncbi:MAG: hypothetical protein HYZ46_01800 [Nitrosomonadales bacterium]|nr:hypothetical protein [Nitrosomonadales bacterium]